MEYASNGKANAGLTTGIIGTSLAGLLWANGGNGLGGILGGPRNSGSGCYQQSYDGKISQLESEIAFLRSENYADKVANEVYKSLDGKINENLEKLYGFVIDLDKRTALNAQGFTIIELKPKHGAPNETVFVFKYEKGLDAQIATWLADEA